MSLKTKTILAAGAAVVALLHAAPRAAAQIDALEAAVVGEVRPRLRWDNIEGAPYYVGGVPLERRDGLEVAVLAPGEEALVRLPADALLRLHNPAGALAPDDLLVLRSAGDGVEVEARTPPSVEGRDLLVRLSQNEPALVRILRPEGAEGVIPLALFVSRVMEPELPPIYRERVDLPGEDVILSPRPWDETPFDRLTAGEPMTARVEGPARFLVQTRLPIDGGRDWVRRYAIEATLDGEPLATLDFETSLDLTEPPEALGEEIALGRLRRGYLNIPEGEHLLTLDPNRPVLAHILAYRGDAFLLPRLNAPAALLDAEIEPSFKPVEDLPIGLDAEVLTSLAEGPLSPAEAAALARALAEDARWDGGLAAAALLDRAAEAAPGLAEAERLADEFRGAYTFFRDLAPTELPPDVRQTRARLLPRTLLAPEEGLPREIPAAAPDELLVTRTMEGLFVPLPQGEPLVYPLPPLEAPSELRLLVDRSDLGSTTFFFVQIGEAAPRRVVVRPAPDLPPEAFAPSPGAEGLRRLGETAPLAGPAAPLLDGGLVELPLPTEAGTIRVWSGEDVPIRVAVQQRTSAQAALEDDLYLAAVDALGREEAREFFMRAAETALRCEDWPARPWACLPGELDRPAARRLYNDWIPLLRLLRARSQTVFQTTAEGPALAPPAVSSLGATEAERLAERARWAARAGEPLRALELWSEVALGRAGPLWEEATLGRIDALRALGETYLAERLLESLYRRGGAPGGGAFERLEAEAREADDPDRRIGLLAEALARGGGGEALADLVEALLAGGYDAMALKAGLLLPPEARPAGVAAAAYRADWAETLDLLAPERTEPPLLGDWPPTAPASLAALDAEVLPGEPAAAAAWLDRRAALGGPAVWTDAEPLLMEAAGVVTLRSLSRDLFFRAARAAPGRPVTFRVPGPALFRVEARPLHPEGTSAPLEGWLDIVVSGERASVSVTNNRPSPGLEIVGADATPGTAVAETVAIPPGVHEVRVAPEGFPALVRTSIRRPIEGEARPISEGRRGLATLVRRFEAASEGDPGALARAARLAERLAGEPGVAPLAARLNRQSSWERIETFDVSAGFRAVPVANWAPESPALRARTALLPELEAEEELLYGEDGLALALSNPEPTTIVARLALANLPTVPPEPVTVTYRLDEEAPEAVRLTPADPQATVRVPVPEGEHAIRFSIENPRANRFVRLALTEVGEEGEAPVVEEPEREYEAATPDEPVVLTLEGPAWLRIDTWRDGEVVTDYRFVEDGWQEVVIRARTGEAERLVRVFRLVPDRGAPRPVLDSLPAPEVAPGLPLAFAGAPEPGAVRFVDALPLGGQEDGTWSFGFAAQQRLPVEEAGPRNEPDQFLEYALAYREFDPRLDLYWRSEGLGRIREESGPTLGFSQRVEYRPEIGPFTYWGRGELFGQQIDGEGLEWSVGLQLGAVFRDDLTLKTAHSAAVTGFARYMSLSGTDDPEAVDADVFTAYKEDHPVGLRFGYGVTHRPWLDTTWSADLSLTTNPEIWEPDHVALDLEWRQLVGPVTLEAGYRHGRYFSDESRNASISTNLVNLGAEWERWTEYGRFEIGGDVGYRLDRDEAVGLVSFTWSPGRARDYRDFTPGETAFEGLRRRDLFDLEDNAVVDVYE